jgi:hypothetical protein
MNNIKYKSLYIPLVVAIIATFISLLAHQIITVVKAQLAQDEKIRVGYTNSCSPADIQNTESAHFSGCSSLI